MRLVLKAGTEEMHGRVEMEIMVRGLEWGVFVIQMRSVTKESLTIITIKEIELLRLAAYVTLVEIWLRHCEEKRLERCLPWGQWKYSSLHFG